MVRLLEVDGPRSDPISAVVVRDMLISETTTLAELDEIVRRLGVQVTTSPSGGGWTTVMVFGRGVGRAASARSLAVALQTALDVWTGDTEPAPPVEIVPLG